MGIKSLTYLLKNKGSDKCIETKKLYELSGKRIAIDASLFIYQSLINIRKGGEPYKNKRGETTSHILGIYYKTSNLLSLDITPVYIFDGKPPEEKRKIIDQRKKVANDCKKQLENETDVDKINQLKKKTVRLTYEIVDDVKNLLDLMGVDYIHMDGEAEGLASELCRLRYVDYIMTEDMDSLAFGTPTLIRKCIDKQVKIKDSISIFHLDEILKSLELDYDQFVEVCILCGCDYCPNIQKIGCLTAYKLIKTHGSIDEFLKFNQNKKKYDIPEDYKDKYETSKHLFHIFKGKINIKELDIHSSTIDYERLFNYLRDKVEIQESKLQQSFEKIRKKYKID